MTRSGRLSQLLGAAILTAALFGAFPATHTEAATPACPKLGGTQLTQSQSFTPSGGNRVVVCSGRLRTFDGTPLHVDVSVPSVAYIPSVASSAPRSRLVTFLSAW